MFHAISRLIKVEITRAPFAITHSTFVFVANVIKKPLSLEEKPKNGSNFHRFRQSWQFPFIFVYNFKHL